MSQHCTPSLCPQQRRCTGLNPHARTLTLQKHHARGQEQYWLVALKSKASYIVALTLLGLVAWAVFFPRCAGTSVRP